MNYSQIKQHLYTDYDKPVRDPLWKHIYLSSGLFSVISSNEFQKLNKIKQLGPTYHVYPGAAHTRFNHSLGVFHIAHKIISSLDLNKLDLKLTTDEVKSFLYAALLHDIGHFPYAHSLKELPLKDHEQLSGEIILGSGLKKIISNETDPNFTAAIIDNSIPSEGNEQLTFFRQILSGVLDPDKLDYLNRDAFFCGIPYGIQDIDFMISKMLPDNKHGLAVSEQGLPGIENILFSKYLMYKTVYWHKTVRIATAMIKKSIFTALNNGVINADQLYHIDDEQFFSRFTPDKYAPFSLIHSVNKRELFKAVLETSFNYKNKLHTEAQELNTRLKMEENIADDLGLNIEEVIIDIPESISFEIDVPIIYNDTAVAFKNSETVFKTEVINKFSSALRKIRILLPEQHAGAGKEYFGNSKWNY